MRLGAICVGWQALSMAFVLVVAAAAHAQGAVTSTGVALSWARDASAESCPDVRVIRAAVIARLGRDPFGDGGLVIEAVASRGERAWVARITARDASGATVGHRELGSDAPDCESLAQAAALAIALVIDPDAVNRPARAPAPAAPEPAPPPTAPAPAPAPAAPASPPPAPAPAEREHGVDLRALGAVGLLPGFAPGLALGTDLALTRWLMASLSLEYLPEQSIAAGRGRVAFGLTAAHPALCAAAVQAEAIAVLLCGGALLGSIHSVVADLIPTAPGDRFWTALAVGARLHAPARSAVRASLGADLLAPLTRHRFTVGGQSGSVFRQSTVAANIQLGLGLHF